MTFFARSLVLSGVVLVSARLTATAQDTNAILFTNALIQAEEMENGEQGISLDLSATNEMEQSNGLTETNAITTPPPDGRMRRLERQRQNRRSYSPSNSPETSQSAPGPASLDYSAFRLITDRNIFDPNRMPHTPNARPQPKVLDSFTLVGTLSYGKGDFAFFDGSSPEFQKVLKPADTIAGYKLVSVEAEQVTLARGTNELSLPVGSQLRRQEDGGWVRVAGAGSYTASTATSSSAAQTDAAPSGPDSDILKRMKQRREKGE